MAVTTIEYERLTGKQKAAILILSLSEEQSGRVLRQMNEDEIRDISAAVAQLGRVPSDVIEKLLAHPWPPAMEQGREVPEALPEEDCVVSGRCPIMTYHWGAEMLIRFYRNVTVGILELILRRNRAGRGGISWT